MLPSQKAPNGCQLCRTSPDILAPSQHLTSQTHTQKGINRRLVPNTSDTTDRCRASDQDTHYTLLPCTSEYSVFTCRSFHGQPFKPCQRAWESECDFGMRTRASPEKQPGASRICIPQQGGTLRAWVRWAGVFFLDGLKRNYGGNGDTVVYRDGRFFLRQATRACGHHAGHTAKRTDDLNRTIISIKSMRWVPAAERGAASRGRGKGWVTIRVST